MMKTISLLSFLTMACAVTLAAQTTESTTTTTTNIQMKGGKRVTLRGCVETDARHDAAALRYFGPDHMKSIATSCS